MRDRLLISLVIVVGCAVLVRGQAAPLQLQIGGGLVTLHAQNVPVRTILAEWARLGGARIVNGDRVAGAPVTLDLERIPERQALDIILRGVSGYMLAARTPDAVGTSMFDRIVILPTSAAPANPTPASGPIVSRGLPVRTLVPPMPAVDQPDDVADIVGAAGDVSDGVPVAAPVSIPPRAPIPRQGSVGLPPPMVAPPLVPGSTPAAPVPAPSTNSTPSNPFGVPAGASARPGEVVPVPRAPVGDTSPDPNRLLPNDPPGD